MQSLAAVLRSPSAAFTLEHMEVEEPREDEVVVEIHAAGMCHTDLLPRELPPEMFAGPIVRGHEGAGIVTETGAAITTVERGDKVLLSFNSCGNCAACARQKLPYCFNFMQYNTGGRADGTTAFTDASGGAVQSHFFGQSSFSTLTVAAERSLVKVPPDTDLSTAAPLACGVQTGAGAVLNSLSVPAGASLVVAGAGTLGLSAIMTARMVGADPIIAIDRHRGRLELAERFGATHVLTGDPAELTAGILDITGVGADFAFDTTGNAGVVTAMYNGLNTIGTIGLSGVGVGTVELSVFAMITGRTITGIMEGDSVPAEFIPRLMAHHRAGEFPYDELITTFTFEDINEAEHASASGEVVKPVLVMPNG